jgi:hypothetical protein
MFRSVKILYVSVIIALNYLSRLRFLSCKYVISVYLYRANTLSQYIFIVQIHYISIYVSLKYMISVYLYHETTLPKYVPVLTRRTECVQMFSESLSSLQFRHCGVWRVNV